MKKQKIFTRFLSILISLLIIVIGNTIIYAHNTSIENINSSVCPKCRKSTYNSYCSGSGSTSDTQYYACNEPGHGNNCTLKVYYANTKYMCTNCGHSTTSGTHRCWSVHESDLGTHHRMTICNLPLAY